MSCSHVHSWFMMHTQNRHVKQLAPFIPFWLELDVLQQPGNTSIHFGHRTRIFETRVGPSINKTKRSFGQNAVAWNFYQCAILGINFSSSKQMVSQTFSNANQNWCFLSFLFFFFGVLFSSFASKIARNFTFPQNCHVKQFSQDWAFCVVVLDLPKYMNDVLHFSIQDNGLYSSIPQLIKLMLSLSTSALSDWLIAKRYLSITAGRKIFISLGLYKMLHIC